MPHRLSLFSILSLGLLVGCVSPALEDLAEAECLNAADCTGAAVCVDGRCLEAVDEICDGFDNDGDQQVDEDFDLNSSSVHCGACDQACVGACVSGTCVEADMGPDMMPCVAEEEVCDGQDNDCDGQIDEDATNACGGCGPLEEICDGQDNDCDGTTDEGVANACGKCEVLPAEICNGMDDDCDGTTDEGFPGLGEACGTGVGACRGEGIATCSPTADAVVCDAVELAPTDELCGDGEDNDCDGATDEGFEAAGEPCSAGQGACLAQGVMGCTDDLTQVVCGAVEEAPGAELCGDGADNDCDGSVDEGFVGLGAPCGGGVGVCDVSGQLVCDPDDLTQTVCSAPPVQPQPERCDLLDNDCDGATDESFDLMTDVENCGLCGRSCALPNAISVCEVGICRFDACVGNFQDLDGRPDTGCECDPDAEDLPDPDRLDANCDGLDGDLNRAVFASPAAAPGGTGTADAPYDDLLTAITVASLTGQSVYLAGERWLLMETLVLTGSVSIHGGFVYDPAGLVRWTRPPRGEVRTRILIRTGPAIRIDDPAADILLDEVHFVARDGDTPVGAIGAVLGDCAAFRMVNGGIEGSEANRGTNGTPGQAVAGAQQPEPPLLGGVALGGQNFACPEGTAGGVGGAGALFDGVPTAGQPGDGNGGLGGAPASRERGAEPGRDAPREQDAAGEAGWLSPIGGQLSLDPPGWLPIPAGRATAGAPGPGGGGGGGGLATQIGSVVPGPSGGGGGSGGCGGGPGGNGTGGSTAIGVLIVGQCAATFIDTTIGAGDGGNGGDGGPGASGETGADGGAAGRIELAAIPAGDGGRGGNGACGGDGAGGNGGHVIGILRLATSPAPILETTRFELGDAGRPGQNGQAPCRPVADAPPGLRGLTLELGCCAAVEDCGTLECLPIQ